MDEMKMLNDQELDQVLGGLNENQKKKITKHLISLMQNGVITAEQKNDIQGFAYIVDPCKYTGKVAVYLEQHGFGREKARAFAQELGNLLN